MSNLLNFRPSEVQRVVWFSTPKKGFLLVRVKRRGWFVDKSTFKPGRAPTKKRVIVAITDLVSGGYFERCGAQELTGRVLRKRRPKK